MLPPSAYFQELPTVLCQHLAQARHNIRIAVCWFSHLEIFELLLKKLRSGVQVELLLEYDSQNISQRGLNFKKFILLGGHLYAYRHAALMHHKFALLDDKFLLSGSFNWTYNGNAENLIATAETGLVDAFRLEFFRLKALSVPVRKIRPTEVKSAANPPVFPQSAPTFTELRKRISLGAGVWWVRSVDRPGGWRQQFREQVLFFDPAGLLRHYWQVHAHWDKSLFDACWPALAASVKPATTRACRCLARRMCTGDVVLALSGRQAVVALGLLLSDPQPAFDGRYSSYRSVQWLRVFPDEPFLLEKPVAPGGAGRFRGAAMRVVSGIFEKPDR